MRERQTPPGAGGVHLVLYDGSCGLCSRLCRFILARDRERVFVFASLRSPLSTSTLLAFGQSPTSNTFYVVANYQSPQAAALDKSRAALFVARTLGWPWRAAALLGLLPRAVLNRLYDAVARHRHRFPGKTSRGPGQDDACWIPDPQDRSRFLDDW